MGEGHVARALRLAERMPHVFTIQYPPSRRYFQGRFEGEPERGAAGELERALLYVHVPFCEVKCHYCNFAVDLRRSVDLHARYVDALCGQLAGLEQVMGARIDGIDVGGGTPTRLSAPLLRQLMGALAPWRARMAVERGLSIETTPRIAAMEPEKLEVLVEGGCERVSIGFQSSGEAVLAGINRKIHGAAVMGQAVEHVRGAGFARLNVDLIFGLPGQSAGQWVRDVEQVIALWPDSVTIYDCLYRGAGRALPRLARASGPPAPEVYGALYDLAYGMLRSAGYQGAYGSVNLSRHAGETGTSAYFEGRLWAGLPYVGVGSYASSAVGESWWFAPYEVDDWLEAAERGEVLPGGACYRLPWRERLAKAALAQLNYGELELEVLAGAVGVSLAEVEQAYGEGLEEAAARGWMRRGAGARWSLAPGMFRALYSIRAILYSPDALTWSDVSMI
jgi:oxygen-independent coproporphyrinogen III oxidase